MEWLLPCTLSQVLQEAVKRHVDMLMYLSANSRCDILLAGVFVRQYLFQHKSFVFLLPSLQKCLSLLLLLFAWILTIRVKQLGLHSLFRGFISQR